MPIVNGGIGTVWTTGHHPQDPRISLAPSSVRGLGVVLVNRADSEPKLDLPLTITIAGRTPLGGDAQG
jgi:hypothetical protein